MLPSRMAAIVRGLALAGALVVVAIGVLTLVAPPPSLRALDSGPIGHTIWSLMLLVGGLVAAAGHLADVSVVVSAGYSTATAGFVVWAIAAVSKPDADLVSWSVALVFAYAALALVQQAVIAVGSLYARRRTTRR